MANRLFKSSQSGLLKYIFQPTVLLSFGLSLITAWYLKEILTLLLLSGRNFEGRNPVIQVLLFGLFVIFFSLLYTLLSILVEKFYLKRKTPRLTSNEIISREYLNIILLVMIAFLVSYPLQYVINFVTFPNPIEYREPAIIYSAIDFSKGINSYTLQNFPEHIYLYGLFYPLLLAPFINLGTHPFLVARWVNVFFIVLFLGMSFWIFRKRGASIISTLTGVLILFCGICVVWKINGARPDVPGLFFAILGFYFLFTPKPGTFNVLMCALTCVVSFYFKQYMLFSAIVVAVYLFLFVSKQKAYLFTAAVIFLGLVSFLVIRAQFPLYYEYSILHHIRDASNSTEYMEAESMAFTGNYWLLVGLYLFYLHKKISEFGLSGIKNIRLMPFNSQSPFLLGVSVDIFNVGVGVSLLLLTFLMGKQNGNTFTYYAEFLLPFLLYVSIPRLDELFKTGPHRSLIQALLLMVCVFFFYQNNKVNLVSDRISFATLNQLAGKCVNILDDTPLVATYKIEHGMTPTYNNGQIDYVRTIIPKDAGIFAEISNIPVRDFDKQISAWENGIAENIKNQRFDCIFSENSQGFGNYVQSAKIDNVLGRTVYFYIPSKSK